MLRASAHMLLAIEISRRAQADLPTDGVIWTDPCPEAP